MHCKNIHNCKIPKHLVFVKGEYTIIQCDKCELRFTDPGLPFDEHIKKVYGDDYFFGGKDGYSDYFEEKDNLITQGENYANIVSQYAQEKTMLDIGSAAGFLMKGFENKGWQVRGIEPNQTMTSYGKEELNLNIVNGSFETLPVKNRYDLVTMVQVIGHFYDLAMVMDKLYLTVKDSGLVLVESWDMNSLYAKILGKNWHEYSPPSVLNWFSRKSLRLVFENSGFQEIAHGLPNKKININHALTLFEHKYPSLKLATKFAEKLIPNKKANISYPPLDVFWSLFKRV